MTALVFTAAAVLVVAGVLLYALHHPRQETTMPAPLPERLEDKISIDYGDLLIAVADTLEEIRKCVCCGEDSTWAGLFVDDGGLVSVSAWCDAPFCERDRTFLSIGRTLALPINHLPGLRAKAVGQ